VRAGRPRGRVAIPPVDGEGGGSGAWIAAGIPRSACLPQVGSGSRVLSEAGRRLLRMTTDPQITAWLDQEDAHLARVIREHRWAVQYVGAGDEPGEPDFGYTIGLFGMAHPELVVVGLDHRQTHSLLTAAAELVAGGRDLVPGELLRWPHLDPVTVEWLPNPHEVVLGANRFYCRPPEHSLPAYQLTWCAAGELFPWDPGYPYPPETQPRPGTWRA
jgi:hypothetical protein